MTKLYASIDTNVIVSAMLTHNPESPTLQVVEAALDGRITYLFNRMAIAELLEVVHRPKLRIPIDQATLMIRSLITSGYEINCNNHSSSIDISEFPDSDDYIFYDIVYSANINADAYLVTGNLKHFPEKAWIVSPAEMCAIINKQSKYNTDTENSFKEASKIIDGTIKTKAYSSVEELFNDLDSEE